MPSLTNGQPESVVMWKEEDVWVIKHEKTGLTTQGRTRLHALLMLADLISASAPEHPDLEEESDVALSSVSKEVFSKEEVGEGDFQ